MFSKLIFLISVLVTMNFLPMSEAESLKASRSLRSVFLTDSAIDYSCVHAQSWMRNTQYSDIFQSTTGISSDAIGEYSAPEEDTGMGSDGIPPPPPMRKSFRRLSDDYETPAWNIEFSGVPHYDHTVTQAEEDWLNNRPNAATDFTSGSTTASEGDVLEFGGDVGYSSSACSLGYWPPGPECPEGDDRTNSFPLQPAPETLSGGCYVEAGRLGTFTNGVAMFGWSDTTSHNSAGVWHPSAMAFEVYDLDICWGHAAAAEYHHHSWSPCFATEIGDTGSGHSPLFGFVLDGYPIYGPYDAQDELAVSCWQARDYSAGSSTGCGTDNERSCVMTDPFDMNSGTTAATAGPDTTDTTTTQSGNTIDAVSGVYYEDFFYNSTCSNQGQKYLDSFNGHSHGNYGYHYHFTLSQDAMDQDNTALPTFPYIIGPKYYGCIRDSTCCTGPSAGACNERGSSTTSGSSTCGTSSASSTFACSGGEDDFYTDDAGYDDTYGDDDDSAAAKMSLSFLRGLCIAGSIVSLSLIEIL